MDENSNLRLRACFEEAGRKYGYDTINAEFISLRDMKIRWQRSYRWADFRVSDYLQDAPDEVLSSLADSLFRRITGKDDGVSKELCDWITASSFHRAKQNVYLSRSVNLTTEVAGTFKNLRDSYNRLIGAGLVPEDPELALTWSKEGRNRKAGQCSVLMNVVSVSKALDTDEVPDFVLDYCLYHEICHLLLGYDPTGDAHEQKFYELNCKFPKRKEAEVWLRRLFMYV